MSSRCRRRPPARAVGSVVLMAGLVGLSGLAGCDTDDGRALAEPAPGATAPPLPTGSTTSTTTGVGLGTPPVGSREGSNLILSSAAFGGSGEIPPRYACNGDDISPPLGWTGVPAGTIELALTVVDVDAATGQSIHWVVAGIDPAFGGLEEGVVPPGAVEARNGISEFGWHGPCPPPGEVHAYVFTLYALTAASGVEPASSGDDAIARIASTPGIATTLTGSFAG